MIGGVTVLLDLAGIGDDVVDRDDAVAVLDRQRHRRPERQVQVWRQDGRQALPLRLARREDRREE